MVLWDTDTQIQPPWWEESAARGSCVMCPRTVPRGRAACNCKHPPAPEYESGVTFVLKVNQWRCRPRLGGHTPARPRHWSGPGHPASGSMHHPASPSALQSVQSYYMSVAELQTNLREDCSLQYKILRDRQVQILKASNSLRLLCQCLNFTSNELMHVSVLIVS